MGAEPRGPGGGGGRGTWIGRFYRSTVGKKIVMAATGLVLIGYLVAHVLGNLLLYRGPQAINAYAEFLKANRALVWTVRAVLLASLVLHVHAAWVLTLRDRAARSQAYLRYTRQETTLSARSLRIGGVVLLLFIVYHLLHLTTGTVHPAFSPTDVHGNLIVGFGVGWVVAFYVLAMVALGLHLQHGIWSSLQTLGVSHPHLDPARRRLAAGVAVLIAVGFASIPLAVYYGLVR